MSDAFWGAMFAAVPAIIASIAAYWKAEKAEARADIAQQLAGVCRFSPQPATTKIPLPVDDNQQEVDDLTKRISLLEKASNHKGTLPGVEWK